MASLGVKGLSISVGGIVECWQCCVDVAVRSTCRVSRSWNLSLSRSCPYRYSCESLLTSSTTTTSVLRNSNNASKVGLGAYTW